MEAQTGRPLARPRPVDAARSQTIGENRSVWVGCPREVAEAVLGHSAGSVVGTYDHTLVSMRQGVAAEWNDHLDKLRPKTHLKLVGA